MNLLAEEFTLFANELDKRIDNAGIELPAGIFSQFLNSTLVPDRFAIWPIGGHGIVGIRH
jgi:hypothetical protein